MATNSSIEWTDATWNPLIGCARVSPGCQHCYAETMAARFSGPGLPYEGVAEITKSGARWTGEIKLLPEKLSEPLRWKKPRTVFVNSMSDLFHPAVPDWFIFAVWRIMFLTPQHTYQILTKRPERMAAWLEMWADAGPTDVAPVMYRDGEHSSFVSDDNAQRVLNAGRSRLFHAWVDSLKEPPPSAARPTYDWMEGPRWWPTVLPNVWIGTSVENQEYADRRIPELLKCPAAVLFLSCEPLLGPVDLTRITLGQHQTAGYGRRRIEWDALTGWEHQYSPESDPTKGPIASTSGPDRRLHWVIAGGESGHGARPMHPDWVRSLRDQCVAAGVGFFFKQWGGANKKATGRTLDGRTWDELPVTI